MKRRDFIKIGGASAAAITLGSALPTKFWGLDANPLHNPGTDGDTVVPTFCELCFWKCGVLAHVKDGRVTKIVGNPAHPLSRGRLCPRGTGGTGLLYDPDRLQKPLIRKGKRGEQKFVEATWDEALDVVAENMAKIRDKYGAEAMALYSHGYGGSWFKHLMKSYGSPNVAAPSYAQCRGPREVGFRLTFGDGVGSPESTDMENSRVITLIGSHLGENMHNTQVQDFTRAIDRGADLIVVDPRHSIAAGKARYWLPIKPGTDLALLLAWMHVIVKERLYDRDYIEQYSTGLDKLEAHLADKTPEWAYTHTTIRPRVIRETARLMAGAAPASLVHPGRHVTWYGDDTQRSRAIAILNALLGSWGRKGGFCFPSKTKLASFPHESHPYPDVLPADMPRETMYPFADGALASGICDASIPGTAGYDIKGWIVYGTNLIQALPNPENTIKAIQELDFMVAVDVLPAEITGWADVVLPESTYLERMDELHAPAYRTPFVALRQPVVEPMFDSKPGWWMAKELGKRLELEDCFPWKDSEEYIRERVQQSGLDYETLAREGVILGKEEPAFIEDGIVPSFDTPSGKIELYSEQLAEAGFDPVPSYTPPEEPPPGSFRLLFGRAPTHTFGRTTNNRFLSSVYDENEIWVNARMAEEMGLTDREKVVLINQDGVRSEPISLKATQRIRPDCVYMVHGYGHDAKGLTFARGRGASDSRLVTRFKTDPLMGGTGMNVNFVSIERVTA